MTQFIQLIKPLKPDEEYPSNNIDISVNGDSFEAMYYTVYEAGINSVTDRICHKETYDARQLNAFVARKQRDGFIALL